MNVTFEFYLNNSHIPLTQIVARVMGIIRRSGTLGGVGRREEWATLILIHTEQAGMGHREG